MFDYPRAARLESAESGLGSLPTPTPAAGALTRSERQLLKEFVSSKPERTTTQAGGNPKRSDKRMIVIRGRILGCDTGMPLPHARLEIWRTDRVLPNEARVRVTADEFGYFEFETVHPFGLKVGKDVWRSAHLQFMVAAKGYKALVTQLFFKGDPLQTHDFLFRADLALPVESVCVEDHPIDVVNFDIVLEPGTGVNQVCSGEVV